MSIVDTWFSAFLFGIAWVNTVTGRANTMKVMVLDDDHENVDILSDTLRSEGFEIEEFTCANKAMSSFRGEEFDVVITDIKMPVMDGLEVLSRVKECRPTTRVILVTGFASMENAVEALHRGAYRFFRKPLDLRELIHTLRKVEYDLSKEKERAITVEELRRGIRELENDIKPIRWSSSM